MQFAIHQTGWTYNDLYSIGTDRNVHRGISPLPFNTWRKTQHSGSRVSSQQPPGVISAAERPGQPCRPGAGIVQEA